jgi:hypothetical protein
MKNIMHNGTRTGRDLHGGHKRRYDKA